MANNFVQEGWVVPLVAPAGGVSAGDPMLIGSIFAVAQGAAAAGEEVSGVRTGIFELAKATSQAWTQGQKVYWDADNSRCTTTASGNTLIGAATAAADTAATAAHVLLTGQIV